MTETTFESAFRDFVNPGVPSSGAYPPKKSDIRATLQGRIGYAISGREVVKTDDFTVDATLSGYHIVVNKATAVTATLTAVATLAAAVESNTQFQCSIFNIGAGQIVVTPDGAETINGAAELKIPQYGGALIWTEGTTWRAELVGNRQELLIRENGENEDVGAGFKIIAESAIDFGGGTGSRIAVRGDLYQTTPQTGGGQFFPAVVGTSYSVQGNGGTDTGANSNGSYFGLNGIAYLGADAENVRHIAGAEINTYTKTGSSYRWGTGLAIAGFNEVRATELDAALSFGGGTDAGFGPHVGWDHGIVFTDIHGGEPLHSGSTLFGTYWSAGGNRTVAQGIDLAEFTFSGNAFRSTNFSVNGSGELNAKYIAIGVGSPGDYGLRITEDYAVAAIDLQGSAATPIIRIDGNQVLTGQQSAISDPSAITAYSAPTVSATYVQAEFQAAVNALATLRSEVDGLRATVVADLDMERAHGLLAA